MSSESFNYPVAISRLTDGERSREPQNARAVRWLLEQPGGQVVVVTPRREVDSPVLKQLVAQPNVRQVIWRGFSIGMLSGRVLHAWPNRDYFQKLWGQDLDALAVIEWNEDEAAEWIEDANPVQLFADRTVEPVASRMRSSANRCRTASTASSSTSRRWRPDTRPGSSGTKRTSSRRT